MTEQVNAVYNQLIKTLTARGVEFNSEVNIQTIMKNFESSLTKEYRKEHGVVYTPNYIARAMAKSCLAEYLTGTYDKDGVREKLREVKICDPCVGSGVYPLAIIEEIVDLLGDGGNTSEARYDIIKNNLYCLDLDKNAVDITKFRLWCLVEDIVSWEDFKCNIWNGNSLNNTYHGKPIYLGENPTWESGGITCNLKEVDYDYYCKLNKAYNNWVDSGKSSDLLKVIELNLNMEYAIGMEPTKIVVGRNTVKSEGLFDFKLMFGKIFKEKGGFDIFIGNPPYVRNVDNRDYYHDKYLTDNSAADMYVYFFEVGYNSINSDGIVSLITPNKFYSALYATELRRYLRGKLSKEIDFCNFWVFENAWVPTAISFLNKQNNQDVMYCNAQKFLEGAEDKYSALTGVQFIRVPTEDLKDDKFVFDEQGIIDIKNKLENMPTKLGDLFSTGKGVPIPEEDRLTEGYEYSLLKGEDLEPYREKDKYPLGISEDTYRKYYKDVYNEYIAVREISKQIEATIVRGVIPLDSITIVNSSEYWLIGFLNSKVVDWIYNTFYCRNFMSGYAEVKFPRKTKAIERIPIPDGIECITENVINVVKGIEVEHNKKLIESKVSSLYGIEIKEDSNVDIK